MIFKRKRSALKYFITTLKSLFKSKKPSVHSFSKTKISKPATKIYQLLMSSSSSSSPTVSQFGVYQQKPVHKINIESPSGNLRASFITFGAILQSLQQRQQQKQQEEAGDNFVELTLGYSTLDQYVNGTGHLGATCGRFANRIANGTFPSTILGIDSDLEGSKIELPTNNNGNCLHGGPKGFSRIVWDSFDVIYENKNDDKKAIGVVLKHVSHHNDEGFPGEVHITATYTFSVYHETNEEALFMDFKAFVPEKKTETAVGNVSANTPTVINICNHSYWHLGGYQTMEFQEQINSSSRLMDTHHLHIPHGKFYLALNESIPTGEILSTKNTFLDFVSNGGKKLSEGVHHGVGGYDHCIVLADPTAPIGKLRHACTLTYHCSMDESNSNRTEDESRKTQQRQMKVYTTLPGMQVYSGNFLRDDTLGHAENVKFGYRGGLALETQLFPDSPNHSSHFPSCVVKPGETWSHVTIHSFS